MVVRMLVFWLAAIAFFVAGYYWQLWFLAVPSGICSVLSAYYADRAYWSSSS